MENTFLDEKKDTRFLTYPLQLSFILDLFKKMNLTI